MFTVGQDIRITVASGSDEDPIYVFGPYTDPKMRAAIKQLGSTRVEYRKNRPVDKSYDRRIEFFDATCKGVENFGVVSVTGPGEDDEVLPLTEAYAERERWLAIVPDNHKTSCAAHFEERGTLTEDEQGN